MGRTISRSLGRVDKGYGNALGKVHPVIRLGVLRVVDLLRGVDGGVKVLKDAASLLLLAVNEQSIAAKQFPTSAHMTYS